MTQLTIQQAFDLALQHHQAGRLPEAEQLYRQILARQPEHFNAMYHLGVIAHQAGHNDMAVGLIRGSIARNPNLPGAHYNLGNALQAMGQLEEAIAAFRLAIALWPDIPEAHNNLGNVLQARGQLHEAIAAYRQAVVLRPDYAAAHYNLGNALQITGQSDEAIAAFRQAIALRPEYAEAHNNLGVALKAKGQLDQAIAAYRQAISLRPDYAQAHNDLGVALTEKGQPDEAIAAIRQAILLRPDYADAHSNLGVVLRDKEQLVEAIAACRQAIALEPDHIEGRKNLALLLLQQGEYQQGWEEYEWRWKHVKFPPPMRNFSQPLWDGSPLGARTLLLHTEQGLGDAIQFFRYLPLLTQRGGKIIIECQPELQRLLRMMSVRCQIVTRGDPLPVFDVQCPLLRLPWAFGTTLENIPKTIPYLHADVQDVKKWQQRLHEQLPIVKVGKVGLVWAGNPVNTNDCNRSIKLQSLAPLGQAPGVCFFSLQKGEAAAQARTPPAGMELVDWTSELKDFADTAALIANLDLIISVDTAVVHLAGAMGKPVWTLLPFNSDWRWLLKREDSPWYPSVRLFRPPGRGDWDSVIKRVVDELTLWTRL
jgi:tetratricopeptide (TPR) repeat protein